MKKIFNNGKESDRNANTSAPVVDRKEVVKRVEEGTKFTIKEYGGVLEALAKFDKAEPTPTNN